MNKSLQWILTSSLALAFSQSVFADLNKCRHDSKKAVEQCNAKFNSVNQAANQADMANVQRAEAMGPRARGGGADLMNAANENARRWAEIKPFCMDQKRTCADSCNSVPPPEKKPAEDAKFDCFGKIEEKITLAQQYINQNVQAANESAYSGNQGGSQDAEDLQGSNMNRACAEGEVCGERHPALQNATSNLDMLRKLQQTHDCTTSGSGSEARCVGAGGSTVYVPIGPGDAFRPFRGQ